MYDDTADTSTLHDTTPPDTTEFTHNKLSLNGKTTIKYSNVPPSGGSGTVAEGLPATSGQTQ